MNTLVNNRPVIVRQLQRVKAALCFVQHEPMNSDIRMADKGKSGKKREILYKGGSKTTETDYW